MRPHHAMLMLTSSVGLAILLMLGWQQYDRRQRDRSRQPRNNLKQLSLAMYCFAQANDGSLPPPAICSPDGKPLLSWRVALLPYLEQQELYDHFRLNEPWDSPHNITLLPRMPSVFEFDADDNIRTPNNTFFQVLVGPGTAFEGAKGLRVPGDFPDGASSTILIVEANHPVPWTAPEELSYAPHGPLPSLGGHGRDGFLVAMSDASARWVSKKTSAVAIRAAITRNGGEKIRLDDQ